MATRAIAVLSLAVVASVSGVPTTGSLIPRDTPACADCTPSGECTKVCKVRVAAATDSVSLQPTDNWPPQSQPTPIFRASSPSSLSVPLRL